jgi:hypothetical protein
LNESGEINWKNPKAELPRPSFDELIWKGKNLDTRLAGLWGRTTTGDLGVMEKLLHDPEPAIRRWAVDLVRDYLQDQLLARRKFEGQRTSTSKEEEYLQRTAQLLVTAASDPSGSVRFAVAVAVRQIVAGALTINADVQTDVPVWKILSRSSNRRLMAKTR